MDVASQVTGPLTQLVSFKPILTSSLVHWREREIEVGEGESEPQSPCLNPCITPVVESSSPSALPISTSMRLRNALSLVDRSAEPLPWPCVAFWAIVPRGKSPDPVSTRPTRDNDVYRRQTGGDAIPVPTGSLVVAVHLVKVSSDWARPTMNWLQTMAGHETNIETASFGPIGQQTQGCMLRK